MSARRNFCAFAAIVFGLLGLAAPARAESDGAIFDTPGAAMRQPGRLYGGVAFQYDSLGFGRVASPVPVFSGMTDLGTAGEGKFRVDSHGPQANIGYGFGDGTLPAWLGRNFRIELQGGWGRGTGSVGGTSRSVVTAGPIAFDTVDRVFSAPTTVDLSFEGKLHVDRWRTELRAATDFALMPDLFLSPTIGLFGGRTGTTCELRSIVNYPAFGASGANDVRASVNWSDVIGGTVGAALTYKATPSLAFFVSGHAGLSHRTASMNSFDCSTFVNVGGALTCAQNGRVASERRTAIAFNGGGKIGVLFSAGGWFILGVTGDIDHDSRVPGYQARQNLANATEAAARLVFTREINHSVTARITLLLM